MRWILETASNIIQKSLDHGLNRHFSSIWSSDIYLFRVALFLLFCHLVRFTLQKATDAVLLISTVLIFKTSRAIIAQMVLLERRKDRWDFSRFSSFSLEKSAFVLYQSIVSKMVQCHPIRMLMPRTIAWMIGLLLRTSPVRLIRNLVEQKKFVSL